VDFVSGAAATPGGAAPRPPQRCGRLRDSDPVVRSRPRPAARALAGLALLAAAGCAEPERPPNVLLIVLDSLRADHVDHLGYERPTAVALDGFRDQSALFTDAYAAAPWAAASIASLFTGRLPPDHGLVRPGGALDERNLTLAEVLQRHGYATAALVQQPTISRQAGFAQGFAEFSSPVESATLAPDVSELLPWMRNWLAGSPQQPFFVYLHADNTQGPYRVPPEHAADLLGRPPSRALTYRIAQSRGMLRTAGHASAAQVEAVVEQYDSAVRYSLDQIGELLAMLERSGFYDRALIVLTSSNGEELFERGLLGHGTSLHRESVHVPLYVRPPGGVAGHLVAGPVSLVDVAATILELVGLPPGELGGRGRSLAAAVRGGPPPEPRPVFLHTAYAGWGVRRALVDGRYKLEESLRGGRIVERRLFDLSVDPQERDDRFAQGAEVADALTRTLADAFAAPLPAPAAH
jgi:arylsulfatase A-like enzyme